MHSGNHLVVLSPLSGDLVSAPDAWTARAITLPVEPHSLRFGETGFLGQRQIGQNRPVPVVSLCGDQNADSGARQFGAIRQQAGNLV